MDIGLSVKDKKRFCKFVKNINEKDKIALISHIDLDGLASAKIVNKIINPSALELVSYENLDSILISGLKSRGINKIIITDLSVENPGIIKQAEEFSEVLIIDHHQVTKDLNSDKTVFINLQGYCAAFICYSLFSEIKSLDGLDWLVALACLADWTYQNNTWWLKRVYKKYGYEFNPKKPREGKFWRIVLKFSYALIYFKYKLKEAYYKIESTPLELGKLKKYSEIVKKEVEGNTKRFKTEKELIKNGWFYEVKANHDITSVFSSSISSENKDKTYVVALKINNLYKISVRQQDRKNNMALYLKEATKGLKHANAGGHIAAAGTTVALEDYEEFKKRIKILNPEEFRVNT